jgi:hypothetical protein
VTTLKRLAATALTAAIITVPTVAVNSADAEPAKSWTTISKWEGAKQQACKVPARNGEAWKIYSRLVNGKKAKIGAGLIVMKGDVTRMTWRSGLVAKGKTSKVGSVVLPKKAGYTLEAFQFQSQMGDGGPVKAKEIGRC